MKKGRDAFKPFLTILLQGLTMKTETKGTTASVMKPYVMPALDLLARTRPAGKTEPPRGCNDTPYMKEKGMMQTNMRHTAPETSLLSRSQDMKKLLLAALIVLSLVAVSGRASAGVVRIPRATVTYIGTHPYSQWHGGVVFGTVAEPVPAGQGINCHQFVIAKEAFNFNAAMTLLLTAYASRTPVDIFAEPVRYNNELTATANAYDDYVTCAVKELWLAP